MKKQLLMATILILTLISHVCAEDILVFGNEKKPPKFWGVEAAQGILVDILKSTEQELGVSFKIMGFPWARTYNEALAGNGGVVGLSKTAERLELFDYSIPIYSDLVILVVKKGNEFPFEKFEDLKGKKLGVCRGCSYGSEYESAKSYLSLVEDNSNYSRLKVLLAGRSDVAIVNPGVFALKKICSENKDLSFDDFTVLPKAMVSDANHLAFRKSLNKKVFLKKFNQVIQKKMNSGEIQSIMDKYDN